MNYLVMSPMIYNKITKKSLTWNHLKTKLWFNKTFLKKWEDICKYCWWLGEMFDYQHDISFDCPNCKETF